ncbi:hypothetical protein GOBAR_DD33549 [Gossypium barbadense]|nr:hypothetical protein GOBAR_DD33549 [Gossypium barbadense]
MEADTVMNVVEFILENFTEMNKLWIEGVDLEIYKETVLPRVLEQVDNCKDDLAQYYLMDCVVQVFPNEYHLPTLETLLDGRGRGMT